MNQSQFANVMGTHRSQVTRWISLGMPTEPDGTVDPEKAAHWVHTHIDPVQRIRVARANAHKAEQLRRDPPPAGPPGTEHLTDPADGALVAVLPMLAYRVPATAAAMAAACGVPLQQCYSLHAVLTLAIMQEVGDTLEALDVPVPPGSAGWSTAPIWAPDGFSEVDWASLAAAAGEPVDVAAWERHKRALPFYAGGEDGAPQADARGKRRSRTVHSPDTRVAFHLSDRNPGMPR